jgi:hypothetical protein
MYTPFTDTPLRSSFVDSIVTDPMPRMWIVDELGAKVFA